MISLFGKLSLLLALFFAVMQSVIPLIGFFRNNLYALAAARPSALGQCVCVIAAYALLTIAFATNDFSIAYVAANSHPSLPLMYRLTALWGAHEGSILLWILILNVWTLIFSLLEKNNQLLSLTISILGWISVSFLSFLLLTSNPFLNATEILSGNDLNPLLQDPGFVIHPPMLYIGYVGFSVAFAITQAALLAGRLDDSWARTTRQFALAAWCFLTFGITLGSWWAYRVLGWGGFWFWDPVENASLLPWLGGVALIHVLLLAEKKAMAKAWAALLSIICFALSLLGTFLVRSGVLISAHTFANDPARGVFLLLLLALLVTAALLNYMRGISHIPNKSSVFPLFSKESALLINSGLLITAMLTILLGTLYPLIIDALHLGAISVGAPYFNKVMMPLVFIVMALMGLASFSRWQGQVLAHLKKEIIKKLLISFVSAAILLWFFTGEIDVIVLISLSLCFWIIASLIHAFRPLPAMSFTHLGFAILVIGIMLSSLLNEERDVKVKPGDATPLGPYQFFFIDTQGINGSNYRGIRATFDVMKNNKHITNLYPEKRIYTVRDMVMTKVDIEPGIFRDLYIALGEPLDNDYWTVRLYYKPFMRWIWLGGLTMMLGGILAIWQRKHTKNPL